MGVEEVRISSAAAPGVIALVIVGAHVAEEPAVHLVGVLPVAQAGVEVNAPAAAPAGGLEAPDFQGLQSGIGKRSRYDLVTGIGADEVRLVAVQGFRIGPVMVPFLEFAHMVDLVGTEPGELLLGFGDEIPVHPQFPGGGHGVGDAFPDDGEVGGGAVEGCPAETVWRKILVLRGCARRGDEFAVLFHEPVQAELGRALEDGIVAFQVGAGTRVEPMLPEVGRQPGAAHRPVRPAGVAGAEAHGRGHGPDVGIMTGVPAPRGAIQALGGRGAIPAEIPHKAQQDLVHLGETGRLGGPVVFLQVDVDGVVAAPRRFHAFVPQTLQVRRDPFRPGRGDQEISSILIVKRFQLRVRFAKVRIALELDVGGKDADGVRRRAQVDGDAVEQFLVIRFVPGQESGETGRLRGGEIRIGHRLVRLPFLHRILVEPVETAGVDYVQGGFAHAFEFQDAVPDGSRTALDIGGKARAEMDAPLRVIPVFVRADEVLRVIAGIGMPGGIAVHGQTFLRGRYRVGQFRFQPDAGVQGLFRNDVHDDDRVGRGNERLAAENGAVPQVRGRGDGPGEVQRTHIIRNGRGIVVDPERAERHVCLAEMPLQAALKLFGSAVILAVEGLPHGLQGLGGLRSGACCDEVRMLRTLVRFAGPKGDVVQGDVFVDRIAIDHGAQAAVAQRQRLFEVGRRPVVVQGQGTVRSGRAGRHEKHEGKDAFSHSTGLFSRDQPVMVERTGMRE